MTSLALVVPTQLEGSIVALDGELVDRASQLLARATQIRSVDDESFDEADRLISSIAGLWKTIEENRKATKRPIAALEKAIDEACRPTTSELVAEKRRLADLLGDYLERKKAEADALEARAAELLQQAIAAAEQAGAAPSPANLASARQAATVALDLPRELPRSSVSLRQHREVEIVDFDALPHRVNGVALLKPDKVAIRKLLDAGIDVPGARLVVKRGTSTRAKT